MSRMNELSQAIDEAEKRSGDAEFRSGYADAAVLW